jgi:hypothetical protein
MNDDVHVMGTGMHTAYKRRVSRIVLHYSTIWYIPYGQLALVHHSQCLTRGNTRGHVEH